MGIDSQGWLTWAERLHGPSEKQYSTPNAAIGYIPHSAVGYLAGWKSRLFSQARGADGRYTPYAAASVHGWIEYDGQVIQHYPFTVSCWANGNRSANTNFVAFENAGGAPGNEREPLTDAQVEANVRIIRELSAWRNWTPVRGVNLIEHNEAVRQWGGGATSCPSSRIPWGRIMDWLSLPTPVPTLVEEEDMQIEMFLDEKSSQKVYAVPTNGVIWQLANNEAFTAAKKRNPDAVVVSATTEEINKHAKTK